MNSFHFKTIATELKINQSQVKTVTELFADGATVPFIARYRKEMTGSLDEVYISKIQARLDQLSSLEAAQLRKLITDMYGE